MDLGLTGRVALVTGGSQGIGRAIAAGLVAEGCSVALSARSRDSVDAAAQAIGGRGFVWDSADLDDAPRLVGEVESALGPIDVLICNTGGPPAGPDPLGFTREQWEAAYRTLVLAQVALIELVMPGMRSRGWGRIVSVGSTTTREVVVALMLSNSHRAALLGALKTIARAVACDGVTLNSVLPGHIATSRLFSVLGGKEEAESSARKNIPAGRLGRVEEIAAAAAFLCSDQGGYITGQALAVDGGLLASI